MLAGELPWDKPVFDCPDFVSWVKNNSYQKTPWCKIENSALSLIRNILKYDPSQRLTIREIKSSQWFIRPHKAPQYESSTAMSSDDMPFLSQPTYIYFNEPANNLLGTELEVTDSQQNCECSMHKNQNNTNFNTAMTSNGAHFASFSQPISTDDMLINSQIQMTQPASQFSQSPFLKLVKRMTRMFIHNTIDGCTEELKKLFQKFMYDYKLTIINQRQRQLTVVTADKRQTLLTFKVNIIEMNHQNEVLVDFRLSRGDGLEFKKIFMKIKSSLAHVVCKKYVFTNLNACCASQRN
jgi:serine/threonine-protein kinase Chk1